MQGIQLHAMLGGGGMCSPWEQQMITVLWQVLRVLAGLLQPRAGAQWSRQHPVKTAKQAALPAVSPLLGTGAAGSTAHLPLLLPSTSALAGKRVPVHAANMGSNSSSRTDAAQASARGPMVYTQPGTALRQQRGGTTTHDRGLWGRGAAAATPWSWHAV